MNNSCKIFVGPCNVQSSQKSIQISRVGFESYLFVYFLCLVIFCIFICKVATCSARLPIQFTRGAPEYLLHTRINYILGLLPHAFCITCYSFFYILFIFHCTILSFFRRTEYFRNTGMVLPELSRTMAYATRKTVNRLHLNHLVSERPKEE